MYRSNIPEISSKVKIIEKLVHQVLVNHVFVSKRFSISLANNLEIALYLNSSGYVLLGVFKIFGVPNGIWQISDSFQS